MESTATGQGNRGLLSGSLFYSNQVAAFDSADRHVTFATKIRDCVIRTFGVVGTSATMQQVILWNLSVSKKVGLDEVADKPTEFMDGLRALIGDAGADVFEQLLLREVRREFGKTGPESGDRRSLAAVLQSVASEFG
jgi:hypothetical protein